MNNKKLWHTFGVIFFYMLFTALLALGCSALFRVFNATWLVPFIIGVVFWIASLVFLALREEHIACTFGALLCNVLGCGFFIGAFLIGKNITLPFLSLPLLSVFISLLFLLLMLLLTPATHQKLWYVIPAYILWLTGSIFATVYLAPLLLETCNLAIPAETEMFLLFFLVIFGFLSLGAVFGSAEDFIELLQMLILPAICATFFILIIVLLCLLGCDDCECGDGDCCDCCDCSGGELRSTTYGKKKRTSMSKISSP